MAEAHRNYNSVTKHLNVLRKTLEKLYLVFIIPIFEYATEVWDNCGISNANRLEQLQFARIVTGLPIFT